MLLAAHSLPIQADLLPQRRAETIRPAFNGSAVVLEELAFSLSSNRSAERLADTTTPDIATCHRDSRISSICAFPLIDFRLEMKMTSVKKLALALLVVFAAT